MITRENETYYFDAEKQNPKSIKQVPGSTRVSEVTHNLLVYP